MHASAIQRTIVTVVVVAFGQIQGITFVVCLDQDDTMHNGDALVRQLVNHYVAIRYFSLLLQKQNISAVHARLHTP